MKNADQIIFRIKRNNKCMDEEHSVADILKEGWQTIDKLDNDPTLSTYCHYLTVEKLMGSDNYYYKNISYKSFYWGLMSFLSKLDSYVETFKFTDLDGDEHYTDEDRKKMFIDDFEEFFSWFDIELVSIQYLD